MNVIKMGDKVQIYGDSLELLNSLPAKTYTISFSKMQGFFLSERADMEIAEKVYGVHEAKCDKVLRSFTAFTRNLGVILSGNKGIGKSMMARMLAREAVKRGIPVLIADQYVPGIASFIDSIDQEVMILLDEFDKTFGASHGRDDSPAPQTELLPLLDGVSSGKKLFVVTCNSLDNISSFMVNRPGRFHYHFRFGYPTAEEVEEYLRDKLHEEHYKEIEKVISFSKRVDLNFDCLRSIAFELNLGLGFEEAIQDLNILNVDREKYTLTVKASNGETFKATDVALDLFSPQDIFCWVRHKDNIDASVEFSTEDIVYDAEHDTILVPGECVTFVPDEGDIRDEQRDAWKDVTAQVVTIAKKKAKSLRYYGR